MKPHSMPNPEVVPIFWGEEYVRYPDALRLSVEMITDLVEGPFMNGLAQYGVARARVLPAVVVEPQFVVNATQSYRPNEVAVESKLRSWLANQIEPPQVNEINRVYLIIPPTQMVPIIFNGNDDPIGNGIQGIHYHVRYHNRSERDDLFYAIIKTVSLDPSSGHSFAQNIAAVVGHELVETFVDRDGGAKEVGDDCNSNYFQYKDWPVQMYWSEWSGSCVCGNQPISVLDFLRRSGNGTVKNLLKLKAKVINCDYIANTMYKV